MSLRLIGIPETFENDTGTRAANEAETQMRRVQLHSPFET
jgi:hypothetical protein